MAIEADLGRIEAEPPGGLRGRQSLAPHFRQARQPEAGLSPPRPEDFDRAGHDADLLLEAEQDGAGLTLPVEQRQQHRRADGRVAGEGQFVLRREDAQRGAVPLRLGRRDEHRFRQVELAGDALHARVVETLRIEHHGERVSGERLLGEDVQRGEAAAHGLLPGRLRSRSISTTTGQ